MLVDLSLCSGGYLFRIRQFLSRTVSGNIVENLRPFNERIFTEHNLCLISACRLFQCSSFGVQQVCGDTGYPYSCFCLFGKYSVVTFCHIYFRVIWPRFQVAWHWHQIFNIFSFFRCSFRFSFGLALRRCPYIFPYYYYAYFRLYGDPLCDFKTFSLLKLNRKTIMTLYCTHFSAKTWVSVVEFLARTFGIIEDTVSVMVLH